MGTYKAPTSSECQPCPVGTYSEGGFPYPKECEPCPSGTTTPGKGSYSIDQCGKQQQANRGHHLCWEVQPELKMRQPLPLHRDSQLQQQPAVCASARVAVEAKSTEGL